MKFDEHGFRQLVGETEATIIRLGTTSHVVLDRYKRFTEMLVDHLKTVNHPFELMYCLEWTNSLEHDPAAVLSSSYVDWIALHRFVHLLAEQQAGTLTHWRHYLSSSPELPRTVEFREVLSAFQELMREENKRVATVAAYGSNARRLLLYLENVSIFKFPDVRNQHVLDYLKTDRFKNRNLKGVGWRNSFPIYCTITANYNPKPWISSIRVCLFLWHTLFLGIDEHPLFRYSILETIKRERTSLSTVCSLSAVSTPDLSAKGTITPI